MIVKRKLDAKKRWFGEARFGMFVHFGLYAIPGRGEWLMHDENIPREEYEKLMKRFNPRRFDADAWVDAAKQAGAKYITFTAKHIDGFCLFDSKLTDYKITNTPFRRDLTGELIDACHRKGMRIVLYYCQFDWHHPNYVHRKGQFKDLQCKRSGDDPDWDKYLDYYIGQVRELCTRYGRIDGIWFDGTQKSERTWRGRQVYKMINRYQPGAVVNDRGNYGDYFTPERRLSFAPAAAGYMVEACQAISRDAWGYAPNSPCFTSPTLIRSLVRMASVGGNYLLNIGPKPDGTLPADQVRRLEDIGGWLKEHGRSVFGAEGCPMQGESEDMLYTRRGNRLYLHLLRWPETDRVALKRLRAKPLRARLLKTGRRLSIETSKDGVALCGLPSLAPDQSVNVVELVFGAGETLRQPPRPGPGPAWPIELTGITALPPSAATFRGFGPKGSQLSVRTLTESQAEGAPPMRRPVTCIHGWYSPEQKACWRFRAPKKLRCRIDVEMSCPVHYSGSTFRATVGRQTVEGRTPGTLNFDRFKRVQLGVFTLPKGISALTLVPKVMNFGYVFAAVRRVLVQPL